MRKTNKLLFKNNEWNLETISKAWEVIDDIARNRYGLDYHQPRFEVITYEQMLSAYSTVALPDLYNHWSFGKKFCEEYKKYKQNGNLAFEVVINTAPVLTYLMETNTATMQTLVIAHASAGHASFFKGNYLFQEHAKPEGMLQFLEESKKFISKCEELYGVERVEELIDAAHSIQYHSIDKHKRVVKSRETLLQESIERVKAEQSAYDPLEYHSKSESKKETVHLQEQEDNLLYFIEHNSPILKNWEKDVLSIIRKTMQYFYPQMQTQVMNEGWASFWHFTIMKDLFNEGYVDDSAWLETLHSHTAVTAQGPYTTLNPYRLGFDMYTDIKRIVTDPTDEDRSWFPEIAGTQDWLSAIKKAMYLHTDSSFIQQYLSPSVIRNLKLFSLSNKPTDKKFYTVTGIHDDGGYQQIITDLANQQNTFYSLPHITVQRYDRKDTRRLFLGINDPLGRKLKTDETIKVGRYVQKLWGYPVIMEELSAHDPWEGIL